jgi:hypothetical protein
MNFASLSVYFIADKPLEKSYDDIFKFYYIA